VILKIVQRFALSKAVRKLVEIAKPNIVILPAGVGEGCHAPHFLTVTHFGKAILRQATILLFRVVSRVQNDQFRKELLIKTGIPGNQP